MGNFGKNWQVWQPAGCYSIGSLGNGISNRKFRLKRKDKVKRKSTLSLFAAMAAILLFILFAVSVVSAAEGGSERPFRATLAGSASWEFPGFWPSGCTEVTTLSNAAGQATHMGLIEYSSSHCPMEPDYVNDGMFTIIAANGDELYGTYNYDPNSESNEILVTLNGGTGRFVDASGAAVLTYDVIPQFIPGCNPAPDPFACFDFSVPWPWFATLTGTISY